MEEIRKRLQINPTLACANRLDLKADLDTLQELGTSIVHIDIMDGHYVPNLCFDVDTVRKIRESYGFLLDVHLMVTNPQDYIEPLKDAGVNFISFHFDSVNCPVRLLKKIQESGIEAGIALNPAVPVEQAKELLPYTSYILVMGVEPGFSGQSFLPSTVEKIKELSALRREKGYYYLIEVDGGIDDETTLECIRAGGDILVTGAFGVFSGKKGLKQDYLDYKEQIERGEAEMNLRTGGTDE